MYKRGHIDKKIFNCKIHTNLINHSYKNKHLYYMLHCKDKKLKKKLIMKV